jgi:hypothetical protein
MEIAIAIMLVMQVTNVDAKKMAGALIILDGVTTARSFELNHEGYRDVAVKRIRELKESSVQEPKKTILVNETRSLLADTERAVERKWTMPVVDFGKASYGHGGLLASSSVTVVDSSACKFLALKPVFIEWKVLDIEDETTMVVGGGTGYDRAMLVDSKFKIDFMKIRISDYPTSKHVEGSTVKFETLAYCTGIEDHLGDRILAFKLFQRSEHNSIVSRGQKEGKKMFEDMKETFDKTILETK